MNLDILDSKIQEFIDLNIGTSISKLALQKNPFPAVEWISIINQIAAKSKAKDKLPTWFSTKNIIYPSKISVEQTSSEKTALYKSSIVSGDNLIDLTGGFGIDDYYFSKKIKNVAHCEINSELSNIVQHNCKQLNSDNITCYAGDSFETLSSTSIKWDWIYIDPSRRNDSKGKVFMLKDCLPNVPENLNFYFEKSNSILIKTAPILDITAGINELNHIKSIHIVAVDNEVKELLWELNKDYNGTIIIKTVNLLKEKTETFEFILNEINELPSFGLPQQYLYEPNSSIMKSGGFDQVGLFFGLNKLHKHSHLYTSNEQKEFPGRIFEIKNCIAYNKNEMKHYLENQKANITTRNFSDSVESIRKKWKIKDGGDLYCFFTTDENNTKIVLICNKIK
ncbi:class I SAM-dependent methyltransferase [Flavobacterium sp. M31R6]|uniref:THUMP-like domain-containing protein n=1 Tax=Flavobacterium sp. M31R6 TaxID=2739062 RepID=UPI001568CA44|nr:class I SAM-dependent methyltransferase [Flavobacterium sp. M31R6]QKJ63559.1 class I SAM-dependent methyltransferase [Flavobacterium sp. M31R6]